jgi:endogenous inhibitor of DNA gyrase (YacG/DUF329 family)
MYARSLLSCPLCGESIEIRDLEFEAELLPIACPICGSFVDDGSVIVVRVPDNEPRVARVKR